ncbi:Popeye domain containing protein [Asbolus verrucosus]|uniref:Popeye domain containing protein n=1 Tax=Asbolus verrucosus TaxID=1661398 RepID=A0A482W3I0_ASBVE|nr:Popeye domain containing protein [Asbolus verrucosus]
MPEHTGLRHNEEIPHILFVGIGENNSSSPFDNKNLTYNIPSKTWWPWCDYWKDPQNILFQLANMCFVLAYSSTCSKKGVLFMHCWLILGLMLFSAWAWNIICAPDVFTWNFAFMLMNMAQVFHILYQLRPVKFDPELEEAYHALFEPFKVNVLSDNQFLHPILPCEFLDSPEFESSRNTVDDKFKVSIVAASTCRYLYWQRSALEYLFVKDTYVATVLTTLIARDIATKLYAMNNKIVTAKGSHLDIRLPSITSSLTSSGEYKSPIRTKKTEGICPMSPGTFSNDSSRYRSYEKFKENGNLSQNCYLSEMEPLTELPSNDDLTSNDVEKSTMEVPLIQLRTHMSNRNIILKTNFSEASTKEKSSPIMTPSNFNKNFTYLPENTTWNNSDLVYNLTNTSDYDYDFQTFNGSAGTETTSWALCKEWTPAQHPLFQTANFFFAAAFLVPGSFKQSVLIVRALLSVGYFFLTIWGGVEVCAPDILLWNSLLVVLNLTHTALLAWRFLPPTLTLELTDLYLKVFKPLRVSRKHFKELVKEARVMTLERGDIYAVEDVSPADERLSILLKGK